MSVRRIVVTGLLLLQVIAVVGAIARQPFFMGLLLAGLTNLGCFGSAIILSRLVWPEARGSERVVSVAVLAMGLVMASAWGLAQLRMLAVEFQVFLLVGLFFGLATFVRTRSAAGRPTDTVLSGRGSRVSWIGASAGLALVASVLAAIFWQALPLAPGELPPLLAHSDSDAHRGLTLLTVAGDWMHEQAIPLTRLPFTSPAAASQPPGGALVHQWLMLPFHSPALARFSQLPLALLGAVALAGIGKQAGLSVPARALAPVAWLSLPVVLRQAFLPGDLLIGSALALACMHALTAYWRFGHFGALGTASAALALVLLTGYESGLYAMGPLAVVLAVVLLRRRVRGQPVLPAAGVTIVLLAVGFSPYVKNLVRWQNPIFPIEMSVGSKDVPNGRFAIGDRQAFYGAWAADVEVVPLAEEGLRQFGWPTLMLAWLGLGIGWLAVRRTAGFSVGGLATLLVFVPLVHLAAMMMFQLEPGHALPVVGLGLIGAGALADRGRWPALAVWGLTVGAIVVTVWVTALGGDVRRGWVPPLGMSVRSWAGGLAIGVIALGCLWRATRAWAVGGAVVTVLFVAVLGLLGEGQLEPATLPENGPGPNGRHLKLAWGALATRTRQQDLIAHAGPVVPFRLMGRGLRANVCYIPCHIPPDRKQWLRILLRWQVNWLVVARIPESMRDRYRRYGIDADGFPRERGWVEELEQDGGPFTQVPGPLNHAVRIYRVHHKRIPPMLDFRPLHP